MKILIVAMLIALCYAQPKVALEGDLMHFDPAIAMFCGKNNQHRSLASGKWITDKEGDSNCLKTAKEILDYCHQVYPSMEFTDVIEEESKVFVEHWCKVGHNGPICKGHSHSVVPYKCIVAPMKKQEKKVVPRITIPESVIDAAQPVESKQPLDEICNLPKVTGFCRAAFHSFYFNPDTQQCTHFIYGGCGGNDNRFETVDDCVAKCGGSYPDVPKKGGKYPSFGLPIFNNLGPVIDTIDTTTESTTTSTTTSTTESTTTTTTESTMSYIDAEIDPLNEDELFIQGKLDEQKRHQDKLAQAMEEFNTANMKLGSNINLNLKTIKKQRKQLKKHLDQTVTMLTEQHNTNMDQLLAVHQAKKDSIANGQGTSLIDDLLKEHPIIIDEGGLPAESDPEDDLNEELDFYEESYDEEVDEDDEENEENNDDSDDEEMDDYTGIDEQLNEEIEEIEKDFVGNEMLSDYPEPKKVSLDSEPEPQPVLCETNDNLFSEASATKWIFAACGFVMLAAVVAFVARFVGVKKQKTTRLQVNDHLTPEERQLLAMQQNGYENPTYKFFEKQQLA